MLTRSWKSYDRPKSIDDAIAPFCLVAAGGCCSCSSNGRHEQIKSRQSSPQQRWRNQRETRKYPDPHVAQNLRTAFCGRYSDTEKLSDVLFGLNETSLRQPS